MGKEWLSEGTPTSLPALQRKVGCACGRYGLIFLVKEYAEDVVVTILRGQQGEFRGLSHGVDSGRLASAVVAIPARLLHDGSRDRGPTR